MSTEPIDATGLFTLACFIGGCVMCGACFGVAVAVMVFLIGLAVVGEMQRLAGKDRR